MPLAILWLWTPQFADPDRRLAKRDRTADRALAEIVIGDFEALCALSAYAAENPTGHLSRGSRKAGCLRNPGGRPPASRVRKDCVMNDVILGDGTLALMVSGSNMSGKSTLLRTVGVNAVLALAGGPVRAASLSLTPLSIGATLRIQDSLQAGKSRFYAEITRVRQMVDLASGRCRFCSCLTSFSTAPIPTIDAWERSRS